MVERLMGRLDSFLRVFLRTKQYRVSTALSHTAYFDGFFSCSIHSGTSQPELVITLAILYTRWTRLFDMSQR